jgi:hypothetical protein
MRDMMMSKRPWLVVTILIVAITVGAVYFMSKAPGNGLASAGVSLSETSGPRLSRLTTEESHAKPSRVLSQQSLNETGATVPTATSSAAAGGIAKKAQPWSEVAKQLAADASPDSWAMSGNVFALCSLLDDPSTAKAFEIGFDNFFGALSPEDLARARKVFAAAYLACGDTANLRDNPFFRGQGDRAAKAGSQLAIASSISMKSYSEGVSPDEWQSIVNVLATPERAALWVVGSRVRLDDAFAKTAPMDGLDAVERARVVFASLCEIVGGCDTGSLLQLRACLATLRFCANEDWRSELLTRRDASRGPLLTERTSQFVQLLRKGDPGQLGIVVKK